MNPYAPPSRAGDHAVARGAPLARKPVRIWIFQILLVAQLAGALLSLVSAARSPEVQEMPLADLLHGLIRPMVGFPVVGALLLTLQRVGPKPGLTAPALASLWWLLSLAAALFLEAPPPPEALEALKSQDAPSSPRWVTALILHAVLLSFVLSTWLHRATRAYLALETAPSKG